MVLLLKDLCLETEAAVLQLSKPPAIVGINGTCVNHMVCQAVVVLFILQVILPQLHIAVREKLVNNYVVAPDGNALVQVIEIIVVVGVAHRKPADDEGGKLPAVPSPLLFRVSLDQLLVDFPAHQADGLLL